MRIINFDWGEKELILKIQILNFDGEGKKYKFQKLNILYKEKERKFEGYDLENQTS